MRLTLLFFAAARDATGGESEATIEAEAPLRVADLRALLTERWAGLGRILPSCRFAVNEAFVDEAHALQDADEVAVVPPVAGG